MEMSSPLAAMHPPPVPHAWGYRNRDVPPPSMLGGRAFPQDSFNFRDLSMKKANPDYFTLAPIQGSSPTASLAADMSSNLHVEKSPVFATPRRSLFTSSKLQMWDAREGTTTPPVRWEGLDTPPIPSSSPYVPDCMDISPLPHKAAFSYVPELNLPSPTPEPTPTTEEDIMLSPNELPPPPPFPVSSLEAARPVSAAEYASLDSSNFVADPSSRRRSILMRPSMARSKNLSTNTVSFKSQEVNNPLPAFKFGAGAGAESTSANASSTSLDECFSASPPQERKTFASNLLCHSRNKPFSINNLARANGSPLGPSIRKPSGPPSRPRSKFRRSLSMFESPGEVLNQKEDESSYSPIGLQAVMDVDEAPALNLPNFTPHSEPDSLPRISDITLVSVLNGDFDHIYDKRIIIDCRFEYEYDGGHIDTAENFCEKETLAEQLFNKNPTQKTLLIFHCEYSAHRAPLMAKFVRHEDRKINAFRYPQLSYPEMYILDGGYSAFFESNRPRCFPQNYLRMDAKEHENACERGMNKLRQRSKLNRAQTFAFGQTSCQMEDSPSAGGRAKLNDDSFNNVGRNTRRLASY